MAHESFSSSRSSKQGRMSVPVRPPHIYQDVPPVTSYPGEDLSNPLRPRAPMLFRELWQSRPPALSVNHSGQPWLAPSLPAGRRAFPSEDLSNSLRPRAPMLFGALLRSHPASASPSVHPMRSAGRALHAAPLIPSPDEDEESDSAPATNASTSSAPPPRPFDAPPLPELNFTTDPDSYLQPSPSASPQNSSVPQGIGNQAPIFTSPAPSLADQSPLWGVDVPSSPVQPRTSGSSSDDPLSGTGWSRPNLDEGTQWGSSGPGDGSSAADDDPFSPDTSQPMPRGMAADPSVDVGADPDSLLQPRSTPEPLPPPSYPKPNYLHIPTEGDPEEPLTPEEENRRKLWGDAVGLTGDLTRLGNQSTIDGRRISQISPALEGHAKPRPQLVPENAGTVWPGQQFTGDANRRDSVRFLASALNRDIRTGMFPDADIPITAQGAVDAWNKGLSIMQNEYIPASHATTEAASSSTEKDYQTALATQNAIYNRANDALKMAEAYALASKDLGRTDLSLADLRGWVNSQSKTLDDQVQDTGALAEPKIDPALLAGGLFANAAKSGVMEALAADGGESLWTNAPLGVQVRKVGNWWVKRVNPNASPPMRWWGQKTIDAQASALQNLGDMATPFEMRDGVLFTKDVSPTLGNGSRFFDATARQAYLEGSKRLGTYFNDIQPRNMGANGLIFDPAIDPITKSFFWGAVGASPIGGAAARYYLNRYRNNHP
jgi:hypothetical protein